MTMNKLLGITLAIVMLTGSIPLGFSEPLRVQLEQGIETSEIQCNNPNHVLVLRSNGNVACVTEKTSEKLGWEIIPTNQIKQISYKYPLSTNDFKTPIGESMGEIEPTIHISDTELLISNLPKIGETAELTFIISNVDYSFLEKEEFPIGIRISTNFEFVDLPQEDIVHTIFDDEFSGTHHEWYDYLSESNVVPFIAPGESFEYTFTIKAVSENGLDGIVSVGSIGGESFRIAVLEDQTLFQRDFEDLYPELALSLMPVKAPFDHDLGTPITSEDIRQHLRDRGYSEEEIEGVMSRQPDLAEFLTAHRNIDIHDIIGDRGLEYPDTGGPTPDDIRDVLRDQGYSEEEIEHEMPMAFPTPASIRKTMESHGYSEEEILKEIDRIHPEISTQSFSLSATSLSSIVKGELTMDKSYLSPVQSSDNGIHGAKVCLEEKDTTTDIWRDVLGKCMFTNENGVFYFSGVTTTSSADGTLDIKVVFTADGEYVAVHTSNNQRGLGEIYDTSPAVQRDIGDVATFDTDFPVGSTNIHREFRAFWILDAITDAREFVFDEFNHAVDKVDVAWDHDSLVTVFNYHNTQTRVTQSAQYLNDVIYLNGRDTNENPTPGNSPQPKDEDDSFERWTIIHEWGHHMMHDIYTTYPPSPNCAGHTATTVSSAGCAWTEGFADILPSLIDGVGDYPRNPAYSLNFEDALLVDINSNDNQVLGGSFGGSVNNLVGEEIEGRVGAAIWDIFDSATDDPLDTLSEGIDEIGVIYLQQPNNIREFYNNWQAQTGYPDSTSIMQMHFMGFVQPPQPTLPVGATIINPLSYIWSNIVQAHNILSSWVSTTFNEPTSKVNSITVKVGADITNPTLTYTYTNSQTLSLSTSTFTTPLKQGGYTVINFVNESTVTNVQLNFDQGSGGEVKLDYSLVTETPSTLLVADAGVDQTKNELSLVRLDGSASTGESISYKWEQTGTVYRVDLSSDTAPRPTFTAPDVPSDKTIQFKLTVTDKSENTRSDFVFVTIKNLSTTNNPPVANAGTDQNVQELTLVTLDGSGTDKDGDSLTYQWRQDILGNEPTVNLSSYTIPNPTFTAPDVTEDTRISFILKVSDGESISRASIVKITVIPVIAPNLPNLPFIPNPDSSPGSDFGHSVAYNNNQIIVGAPEKDVTVITSFGETFIQKPTPFRNLNIDFDSFMPLIAVSESLDSAQLIDEITGSTVLDIPYVVVYEDESESEPEWNTIYEMLPFDGPLVPLFYEVLAINNSTGYSYYYDGLTTNLIGSSIDRAGGAYILDNQGNKIHAIDNPTPESREYFGWSVSANGNKIAVSAREDNTGARDAGTVYLYDYNGKLLKIINNPDPDRRDNFGYSVSLTNSKLIVGAPQDDTAISNGGSVYIYSTTGNLLKTINHDKSNAKFGQSVSATPDGTKILVGAEGNNFGAVYVYDSSGNQIRKIANPTPDWDWPQFGRIVAPYGNNAVLVGNPIFDNDDGVSAGVVSLFDINTGEQLLYIDNPNPKSSDQFGASVSAVNDMILVGTPRDDYDGFIDAGSAYLFDGTDGTLIIQIKNPSPANSEEFGISVASTNNNIIIGVPDDITIPQRAGAIYFMTPDDYTPDKTLPVITIPADKTFEATAVLTPLTTTQIGSATATDNKDPNPTITNDIPDSFPLGDTAITWTATDESGNSTTATQTINIQDKTAPTITAPVDYTAEATGELTPLTQNEYGFATASDIFEPVTISSDAPATFQHGDTTIIWTAIDSNANAATATQTVTITIPLDITPPTFTFVPADITAEATAINTPVDIGVATADDDRDSSPIITNNSTGIFQLGNTVIEWMATDESGNFVIATQIITIQDKTEPQISLQNVDLIIKSTSFPITLDLEPPTVTDNSGNNITPTSNAPSQLFHETITVTWSATDSSGNTSTVLQQVTGALEYSENTLLHANVISLVSISESEPQISSLEINDDKIYALIGSNIRIYDSEYNVLHEIVASATDIAVDDNGIIYASEFKSINYESIGYINIYDTDYNLIHSIVREDISDEVYMPLFENFMYGSESDSFWYIPTVTVDDLGNVYFSTDDVIFVFDSDYNYVDSITYDIIPQDSEYYIDGITDINFDRNQNMYVADRTAIHVFDSALEYSYSFGYDYLFDEPENITFSGDLIFIADGNNWKITITDLAGNFVSDITDANGQPLKFPKAIAIDNLGRIHVGEQRGYQVDVFEITSDTQITSDTSPPVFNQIISNITKEATSSSGDLVSFSQPKAIDNIGGTITSICDPTSDSQFSLGDTVVTCTATDSNGNSDYTSFIVTVQDTTLPLITAPADITIVATDLITCPVAFVKSSEASITLVRHELDSPSCVALTQSDYGIATGFDIFGVTITNDVPDSFQLGTTTITWTAIDGNQLTSTATQTITIIATGTTST